MGLASLPRWRWCAVLTLVFPMLVRGHYGDEDEQGQEYDIGADEDQPPRKSSFESPLPGGGFGRLMHDLPHILTITAIVLTFTIVFTGFVIYLSEKHQAE